MRLFLLSYSLTHSFRLFLSLSLPLFPPVFFSLSLSLPPPLSLSLSLSLSLPPSPSLVLQRLSLFYKFEEKNEMNYLYALNRWTHATLQSSFLS